MIKTATYKKTEYEPLTDVPLPRSIDVSSFHFSLDRVFASNYSYMGESHPFFEIVYVLEGVLGATSGDKIYRLKAGQCLVHFPNEFHRHWSEEETEPHVLNLSFYADCLQLSGSHLLEPTIEKRDLFLNISAQVKEGLHQGNVSLLNRQRVRLEGWLLSVQSSELKEIHSASVGAARYSEIVAILQERISESLSAEEIASLAHMSLSNLKKIFAKYAGMGIAQYFNEMKIRYAAELLRNGARVSEAAYKIGFQDPNYFSTVFRRVTGIAPKDYK